MKRVFSGARPTGRQHLGNLLGAIQNYVKLQSEYECFYCIVDVHALTSLEDTSELKNNIREMLLDWLAAGLDPQKSIIFVQSQVSEVMELHAFLSMITPLGWLLRVPTFKEKARIQPHNVNYGLVGYPVLMTADILLYKAEVVPVGEDQLPHLELAREITRRFNSLFSPVFPEPQARLTEAPIVKGLDGVQKMSKSLNNHIELAATAEETEARVMMMVTDPQRIRRTDPGRPEICNVYALHHFFNPELLKKVYDECTTARIGCVENKHLLAKGINKALAPFRQRRAELERNPVYLDEVLADGALRARKVARETMAGVRESMKLLPNLKKRVLHP